MAKKKKFLPIVWDGMTKKQHRGIAQYLNIMAKKLGLQDWEICLANGFLEEEGIDSAYACCEATFGRRRATITLCKDFAQLDLETKRVTLIHELLHCHHIPITEVGEDTLPELIGRPAWVVYESHLRQQCELMVDNLAVAICRNLLNDGTITKYLEGQ